MFATNLSKDLNKTKNWAIQWKMNFDPDPTEQAQVFKKALKDKSQSSLFRSQLR